MDIRDLMPREVVSATDFAIEFPDDPQVWTVKEVWKYLPPNEEKRKGAVRFEEYPLSIVLNDARFKACSSVWGNHDHNWVGKRISVSHAPFRMNNKQMTTIVFTPVDMPDGDGTGWRPKGE